MNMVDQRIKNFSTILPDSNLFLALALNVSEPPADLKSNCNTKILEN